MVDIKRILCYHNEGHNAKHTCREVTFLHHKNNIKKIQKSFKKMLTFVKQHSIIITVTSKDESTLKSKQ